MSEPGFRIDYQRFNPWWETSDIARELGVETFRRSDHPYKLTNAKQHRYFGIAGAAGSGQTELLLGLAAELVEEGVTTPRDVLYLPLGAPQFRIGRSLIEDAVSEFATYTRPTTNTDGYILLDDVHACADWAEQVERILMQYDDLSVIATVPSEAIALPDRINELDFPSTQDVTLPAKFYDYAQKTFNAASDTKSLPIAKDDTYPVRDEIARAARTGDTDELLEALRTVQEPVAAHNVEQRLQRLAMSYVTMSSRNRSPLEVAHDTELTIYRDVPRIERIETLDDLHALVALASENVGIRHEFTDLGDILECDPRTVRKYVEVLGDLFLVTPSYQYDYSRRRSVKLWLRDPLLLAELTDIDLELPLSREAEQLLIPTVVFDHLRRLIFYYNNDTETVAYDERGSEPIEYVIEGDAGTPIPITLSLNRQHHPEAAIQSFCNRYDAETGLVVGRRRDIGVTENAVSVPLWLFLACC
ncbi:DUF4143 domain-containing protein [Natronorubrum sp. A-ect3]|uniref:DUF4143 domain-containing protein n=1 Tax=Natronorubrum sp. A-ect3 TaxID=3242698 RepID=UPI00359D8F17